MERNELEQAQLDSMMAMSSGMIIVALIVAVFFIIVYWKIFTKAGQPGWAVLIPIYNWIVYFKIIGRPATWLFLYIGLYILYFIGLGMMVNGSGLGAALTGIAGITMLIIAIIDVHRLSRSFGQGAGFTVGLILLGFIFAPILAFGKSYQYIGPNGVGTATAGDNPNVLHS